MNYDHGDKLRNATQWTIIFCLGLGVGAAIEGWRGGNRTFAAIGVGLIAAGCYFSVQWYLAWKKDSRE